jgi:UBX domain-containing protein 1
MSVFSFSAFLRFHRSFFPFFHSTQTVFAFTSKLFKMDANLATFMELTTADRETAELYLARADGDLEAAISLFYAEPPEAAPAAPRHTASATTGAAAAPVSSASSGGAPSSNANKSSKGAFPAMNTSRARGQIQTFADLRSGGDDGGDDDDDDEKEEYYTGGEKSGLAVQNPNTGKGRQMADRVIQKAQEEGENFEDYKSSTSGAFTGTAHRLGQTMSVKTQKGAKETTMRVLVKFFEDGFVVIPEDAEEADCPLRKFDAPASQEFLRLMNDRRVPPELVGLSRGREVHIEMMKFESKWEQPKREFKAFRGSGQTLSSASSSSASSSSAASGSTSSSASRSSTSSSTSKPTASFSLDESKPTTRIAIRCLDGSRVVGTFNLTHSVAQVRAWLESQGKGGYGCRLVVAGMPPRELSDDAQTVEAAGLQNGAINQAK